MYVNHWDLKIRTFLIEYTRLKKHCMDYIKLLELGDILLVQVYMDDIIFGSTKKELCIAFEKFTEAKTASTPIETQKPLLKDEDGKEVDVQMYRSMISSLMYPASSRPDIMFAVYACARYQVNPKVSHLYAVKRIFRYLKGQPKLGLWYPKDSPFDLVAYTDSDYARASLDKKSIIGGCQFLGCRLISWQCKKQTVVANSTTKVEYVAALSCCGQVLWIQNQLLDYGYNFMHTKIFIDNNKSTVRRDLQLEDAEGVDCLPNATIFEQLTLMGSKTTAWNEFSSSMAPAIICLDTNQKFNFSKYIFESMVKNLDNAGNFFMYLRPRKPKRKDTKIPQSSGLTDNVADEAVNEEIDDSLERAATTATSLDAEHDRVNINKTQSKATPNEAGSQGTISGGGPRRQETIGDIIAQTRFENVSKTSNDPLLAKGNTLRSGKDSLKLNELTKLCTNLQQMVLDLETTKTTQANEIASLKRIVKKLEKRNKLRTHRLKRMYRVGSSRRVESSRDEDLGEDASKQGRRINVIDADKDITLVNDQDDAIMFGVNDLDGDEVIVDNVDVVKTAEETTITNVEITLAQAMAKLKSAKPKAVKDKGKGIMIEEPVVEQVKPIKRLEQIRLDEELAFKLQAEEEEEEEEEERLAREKAHQTKEANIAWDNIQVKIEVDYQLAQRLQAQEQEELTDEEKARLFVQFLKQRRKYYAAKRGEEKRNRPPIRAQQRSIITELVEQSSKKAEAEIAQENSSKRAGDKLEQENAKKQKVDDDKETTELQSLMEIVSNKEEVAIDVVPLATKPPTIID
ncbi:hypothetical protein Tco_0611363 [Tanacetum coccineum]